MPRVWGVSRMMVTDLGRGPCTDASPFPLPFRSTSARRLRFRSAAAKGRPIKRQSEGRAKQMM